MSRGDAVGLPAEGFDHYVTIEPGPQNAIQIFREWSSISPGSLGVESHGRVALFKDAGPTRREHDGFSHTLYCQQYKEALN